MKLNDALPRITVDAETYTVTADGEVLTASPGAASSRSRSVTRCSELLTEPDEPHEPMNP